MRDWPRLPALAKAVRPASEIFPFVAKLKRLHMDETNLQNQEIHTLQNPGAWVQGEPATVKWSSAPFPERREETAGVMIWLGIKVRILHINKTSGSEMHMLSLRHRQGSGGRIPSSGPAPLDTAPAGPASHVPTDGVQVERLELGSAPGTDKLTVSCAHCCLVPCPETLKCTLLTERFVMCHVLQVQA